MSVPMAKKQSEDDYCLFLLGCFVLFCGEKDKTGSEVSVCTHLPAHLPAHVLVSMVLYSHFSFRGF